MTKITNPSGWAKAYQRVWLCTISTKLRLWAMTATAITHTPIGTSYAIILAMPLKAPRIEYLLLEL
ncbi:MAG: hypothetical protein A4E46_01390 [Methanosaeta sp. PtaU1.Bin016]|nr:MAG: hypothetical protein A4E46_01390 [Methanosaeta sp. PtaU1.Bin016]